MTVFYSICVTYKQDLIIFKQPVENHITARDKYWERIQNGDLFVQLLAPWTLSKLPCLKLKQRLKDWTLPPSSGTKPTQLGPIDTASQISGPMSIDWAQLSRILPEDEGRMQLRYE
jgi:hypothetical protein